MIMQATSTLTYSTVGGLDLELDLYLPSAIPSGTKSVPVVIYYHPGGLVRGSKSNVFFVEETIQTCQQRGIPFISANYPLLSPFTAKDQIASVKSLFQYLVSPSFSSHLQDSVHVDGDRIAVIGASGGGYITRLTAMYAEPKPKALVLAYGMGGDMLLDFWLSGASSESVSDEDSMAPPKVIDPSNPVARVDVPVYVDKTGELTDHLGSQGTYEYFLHSGTFLDYVTGRHGLSARLCGLPPADRATLLRDERFTDLFPQFHLTSAWPATFLFHGDRDVLVPLEESRKTYDELKALTVKTELVVVEGGNHGLTKTDGLSFELSDDSESCYRKGLEFALKEIGTQ